jgi:hypothetical protein
MTMAESDFLSEMEASEDPVIFIKTKFQDNLRENRGVECALDQIFLPETLKSSPKWNRSTPERIVDYFLKNYRDEFKKWYEDHIEGPGSLDMDENWPYMRVMVAARRKLSPKNNKRYSNEEIKNYTGLRRKKVLV